MLVGGLFVEFNLWDFDGFFLCTHTCFESSSLNLIEVIKVGYGGAGVGYVNIIDYYRPNDSCNKDCSV